MALELIERFARHLPWAMKEDVLSYARSVEAAAPEILREAEIPLTPELVRRLVLVAGARKLYSICSSNFWIIDHSLNALRELDASAIRLGSWRIGKSSEDYVQLRKTLEALEAVLRRTNLMELVQMTSYVTVAKALANER